MIRRIRGVMRPRAWVLCAVVPAGASTHACMHALVVVVVVVVVVRRRRRPHNTSHARTRRAVYFIFTHTSPRRRGRRRGGGGRGGRGRGHARDVAGVGLSRGDSLAVARGVESTHDARGERGVRVDVRARNRERTWRRARNAGAVRRRASSAMRRRASSPSSPSMGARGCAGVRRRRGDDASRRVRRARDVGVAR